MACKYDCAFHCCGALGFVIVCTGFAGVAVAEGADVAPTPAPLPVPTSPEKPDCDDPTCGAPVCPVAGGFVGGVGVVVVPPTLVAPVFEPLFVSPVNPELDEGVVAPDIGPPIPADGGPLAGVVGVAVADCPCAIFASLPVGSLL